MTARITPYEVILEPLEATAFPAIRAEAEQRGSDTRRRDQFLLLGHVGATLKDIVADDAPPEALDEYGELLYQGYQFWTFGRRLYTLTEEVVAQLTSPTYSIGDWQLAGQPASYIQLPYQRIWGRVSAESPYEPVDGWFVVVDDTQPAPEAGKHLRVQLVLGFRLDRPGVSLVSYRTDLNPHAVAKYAAKPWREDALPFAGAIPGGERRGYKTLATTSELETLVVRTLHYLDQKSTHLVSADGSTNEAETHLPHVVVGSAS
jgi:hypothetical protein